MRFKDINGLSTIQVMLDSIFFDTFFFDTLNINNKHIKKNLYEVITRWEGDKNIIVSAKGFYKVIKAKTTILDDLLGTSWQAKVRIAQQRAFETAYKTIKEEEMRNYEIGKFQ
jgi:hypothetical protein